MVKVATLGIGFLPLDKKERFLKLSGLLNHQIKLTISLLVSKSKLIRLIAQCILASLTPKMENLSGG